jgi:hypothetical protein
MWRGGTKLRCGQLATCLRRKPKNNLRFHKEAKKKSVGCMFEKRIKKSS